MFGFALTLLVVSLEVPKTFEELMAVLRGFVPFAITFAYVAWIWYEHYAFFRRFDPDDRVTIALNWRCCSSCSSTSTRSSSSSRWS